MSISKKNIVRFLENYDLGKIIKIQPIKRGLMNKIFHIRTDNGEYILKVAFQNNDKKKLQYEIDLLNFLKNLPTPKPIKQKRGNYVSSLSKNQAFLMTYLPGKHKEFITNQNLKEIGFFIGRMHQQTKSFESSITRFRTLDYSLRALNKIFKDCEKIKDKKIKEGLDYIENEIIQYLPAEEGIICGAIHSDLKPENCLFDKNKLSGVVDFDNSYNAPLIIDLANTIMWFAIERKKLDIRKAKLLVNTYSKKRKLNKIEKAYLPKSIHFVYLRNVLRGIEYYAKGRVSRRWTRWAVEEFLEIEKGLPKLINI